MMAIGDLEDDRRARRGRGRGSVTIADVARAVGVSPMTVSRVINDGANVRAATVTRVRAAIDELAYVPNPAARNLARADFVRLGMLYTNPSANFSGEFMLGALDECARASVEMVVQRCEGDDLDAVERLLASRIDVVLLPPPLCDSRPIVARLETAGVPSVLVAPGVAGGDHASVSIDNFAAARSLTLLLIDRGHRRIGFVEGHPNQTASARRRDGFVAAMADRGLAPDPALIMPGLFTYASGIDAAEQLLALADRPTAIFAANDDMAAAVINVAHRQGLDVPGDIAVAGFDDTPLALSVWPALTTVRQPIAEMGRVAVELAIADVRARRGGAVGPVRRTLDHVIVERQSTTS